MKIEFRIQTNLASPKKYRFLVASTFGMQIDYYGNLINPPEERAFFYSSAIVFVCFARAKTVGRRKETKSDCVGAHLRYGWVRRASHAAACQIQFLVFGGGGN